MKPEQTIKINEIRNYLQRREEVLTVAIDNYQERVSVAQLGERDKIQYTLRRLEGRRGEIKQIKLWLRMA